MGNARESPQLEGTPGMLCPVVGSLILGKF